MQYPDETNNFFEEQATLIRDSYSKEVKKHLLQPLLSREQFAKELFYAPFAVVSHNTDPDPIFNYANLTALQLFEFSWDEFTQLPSRLSAEPVSQEERNKLLAEVTRHGYISHYQGVRIAKSGQRFMICAATVWNLSDQLGHPKGQAACFNQWQYL